MRVVMHLYPEHFEWKKPPYEYEFHQLPIDLIIGDRRVRQHLERNDDMEALAASWSKDLEAFRKLCSLFLLYPE